MTKVVAIMSMSLDGYVRRERRGRRSFRLVLLGRRRGLHSEHEIGLDVPRLGAERRPPEGLAG